MLYIGFDVLCLHLCKILVMQSVSLTLMGKQPLVICTARMKIGIIFSDTSLLIHLSDTFV